jgi:hypothetical protein
MNQGGTGRLARGLEEQHLAMLRDCFNEALQGQRAFGEAGRPLPWEPCTSAGGNLAFPDWQDLSALMAEVAGRVMEWASVLCGFYPEIKEEETGHIIVIDK